jgi:SAM-dependent methyltransferase
MSAPSTQGPHPLAERLIERYRDAGWEAPVLEVAAGVGRNTRAFAAAGVPVVATRDDEPYTQLPGEHDAYAAAFSSHGYLHGATAKVRAGLAELRRVLRPGSPVYITLGSIHDERFGFGEALDEWTFAPGDGPEMGIPHGYFDRDTIVELLRGFTIESLEEVDATGIVGEWAHEPDEEPNPIRHWFVVATRD